MNYKIIFLALWWKYSNGETAEEWLDFYNSSAEIHYFANVQAQWNYYNNVTQENSAKMSEQNAKFSLWLQRAANNASKFDISQIGDEQTKRQLKMISTVGIILNKSDSELVSDYVAQMTTIYNTNPICSWKDGKQDCSKKWPLDPDLYDIMATSRDYDLLEYVWNEWRRKTKDIKPIYEKFVTLSNRGAKRGGFADMGAWWRHDYETDDFASEMLKVYHQILPYYEQLQTYTRRKLMKQYKNKFTSSAIPAHILGNMWAQEWQNIDDVTQPFPGKEPLDVTGQMVKQGYNASHMFRLADEFFQSVGLTAMPDAFWKESVIEKPKDRTIVCHASAWDFYNRNDYRIKMCTSVNMNDLITVHHEMGHVQYYLQYSKQPVTFRHGANPGFHEAIGNTMSLSVSTPAHLEKIGLLSDYLADEEQDINYLFSQSMRKLAFLPFAFMIDYYRWNIFNGTYNADEWNSKWWEERHSFQGITHPGVQRPADAFDPASKSHIDDNTPYIRYFVATIAEFQFYKAMCDIAGHAGPLHRCDFYNNKQAGDKMAQMLQMGNSRPWPEAMQVLTGQKSLDASAILEYFKPLYDYLKQQNQAAEDCYGWGADDTLPDDVLKALATPRCTKDINDQTTEAYEWLEKYNSSAEVYKFKSVDAQYTYNTDMTPEHSKASTEADAVLSQWQRAQSAEALSKFGNGSKVHSASAKRSLSIIRSIGIKLDEAETKERSQLTNSMTELYSNGQICSYDPASMEQDCSKQWDLPENLTSIVANSRSYDLLKYVWKEWRDMVGKPMKSDYKKFVDLSNKGARAAGYEDLGDVWRHFYEDPGFEDEIEELWMEMLPLYEQLHTYVRKKLKEKYGERYSTTALPAHILGNMWAQSWVNIYDFTAPYPKEATIDVTEAMKAKGYDAEKMFHTADEFFTSLGLIKMPAEFWECTMMTKPADKKVVCHPSAWDFYNRKRFCIKMCTQVTMEDLITIHHEMGHIEYYLQYAGQPVEFREGANPGFHEAVGDTISLSVSTPKHLAAIGLLSEYVQNDKQDMNFLYRQALDKIAFLPFGYILDYWRWNVFSGNYTEEQWNDAWWRLRFQYQGLVPPVERGPDDFDPGAKFHVPQNMPYIRYFVSYIVQFQFFKAMCTVSGHTGPLHKCDFYKSRDAGILMADGLRLGCSKIWPEVLELITGSRKLSTEAVMEYFEPLINWLKQENAGECFGWGYEWKNAKNLAHPRCGKEESANETAKALLWLEDYNKQASKVYNNKIVTMWTNFLNITDHNAKIASEAAANATIFDSEQAVVATKFDLDEIDDFETQRQLGKITTVGIDLDKTDAVTFNTLISKMTSLFNNGFICNISIPDCQDSTDPDAKWFQDPTLQLLTATSHDLKLLEYIWVAWRNVTGPPMRPLFEQYIQLGNKGARQGGFSDMGDFWRSTYEDKRFRQDIEVLFQQVLPLYEELHAYVRDKLREKYSGYSKLHMNAIPAHILGGMWGQEWQNLYDFTAPYPEVPTVDVTGNMVAKGWDAKQMFLEAEDFYSSIGMFEMNPTFWNISMITKPKDRTNVACYPDSEDFFNGVDFGIDMCTKVRMTDFVTIHHEMGHIEYFMAYAQQPIKFRDGANAGFHEAIGDTMALSVATPGHLHKIGLLPDANYQPDNQKQDLNFLYKQALEKIAFLPFGYLIDNYRWKVFDGTIPIEQLNAGWWALRYQYQGIVPPVDRSEHDFDPGAKFHVAGNVPYIRYFISFVIQFQFYKALCEAAGHTGPLHKCDFYQNHDAGKLLKDTLSLGSSKPWPEAMSLLANTTKMDASALVEYFSPLLEFLKRENEAAGRCYGWGYTWPHYYNLPQPRCRQQSDSSEEGGAHDSKAMLIVGIVLAAIGILVIVVAVSIITSRKSRTERNGPVDIPMQRF